MTEEQYKKQDEESNNAEALHESQVEIELNQKDPESGDSLNLTSKRMHNHSQNPDQEEQEAKKTLAIAAQYYKNNDISSLKTDIESLRHKINILESAESKYENTKWLFGSTITLILFITAFVFGGNLIAQTIASFRLYSQADRMQDQITKSEQQLSLSERQIEESKSKTAQLKSNFENKFDKFHNNLETTRARLENDLEISTNKSRDKSNTLALNLSQKIEESNQSLATQYDTLFSKNSRV